MTVGELVAYLDLNDKGFNTKLNQGEKRFASFGSRIQGGASKVNGVLMTAAKGGVAALGVGLIAGAAAGIKYNSSIEQTTIAMGTMLGSTSKAQTLIAEVTKMAAATPFEFPELADATKRLVAYGVAAEDAVPLMTRLGDISSALQVPIGELADIYGKMKVSGRITMEDINQLAGRGIPIYSALAKVMGKNQSEIRGLVESGKVGFPQVERAFENLTNKGSMFGGMMEKQAVSFSGLWSTVVDSLNAALGTAVKPLFDWLVKEGMPSLIANMPKIQAGLVSVAGALQTVLGIVLKVFGVFMDLPGSVQKVILGVGALAIALAPLIVLTGKVAGGVNALRGLRTGGAAAGAGGAGGAASTIGVEKLGSASAISAGEVAALGRAAGTVGGKGGSGAAGKVAGLGAASSTTSGTLGGMHKKVSGTVIPTLQQLGTSSKTTGGKVGTLGGKAQTAYGRLGNFNTAMGNSTIGAIGASIAFGAALSFAVPKVLEAGNAFMQWMDARGQAKQYTKDREQNQRSYKQNIVDKWGSVDAYLEHLKRKFGADSSQLRDAMQALNIGHTIPGPRGGRYTPQALGGDYMVRRPTLFLAGEAGPERATFTPQGKAAPGGGVAFNNCTFVAQNPDELLRKIESRMVQRQRMAAVTGF
jgi:tape measure domain-containing protein